MTDDNFKGSRRDGYTPTTLADVMARVRKGYVLTNAEAVKLCDAIERIVPLARDAADELAASVEHEYHPLGTHPVRLRKYERDMETVVELRAALDGFK